MLYPWSGMKGGIRIPAPPRVADRAWRPGPAGGQLLAGQVLITAAGRRPGLLLPSIRCLYAVPHPGRPVNRNGWHAPGRPRMQMRRRAAGLP
jgi:hypothetical protein